MSESNLKSTSKTNRAKVEALTDQEIDTSAIAPLDATFFANARLRLPKDKITALVSVDEETSDGSKPRARNPATMSAALLIYYAQTHCETAR